MAIITSSHLAMIHTLAFYAQGASMRIPHDLLDVGITEEEYAQMEWSNIVNHPGEHIRDILDELGWSAGQLARALDVSKNRITMILNEQRGLSADTAIRLLVWLGTSPEFWLNLQKHYELRAQQVNADDDTYANVTPLETAVTA